MPAKHEGVHVFHANLALHRHERAHARGVQNARHSNDAIFREATDLERRLGHSIEGIRDHNDDALWRMLYDLLDDGFYDVVVGFQQIVAAHSGLAWEPGGDHDHVAARRCGIVTVRRGNDRRARIRSREWTVFNPGPLFFGT